MLSVTIPCTQSPILMRLSMLSLIFSASHCPLNVNFRMVWRTKGIESVNPAGAIDLNLERFLLYHVLKCWQFIWEGPFSEKTLSSLLHW